MRDGEYCTVRELARQCQEGTFACPACGDVPPSGAKCFFPIQRGLLFVCPSCGGVSIAERVADLN